MRITVSRQNSGILNTGAAAALYVDRQGHEKAVKALIEARERHGRIARGALTTLTAPVRATLEALSDPSVIQGMGRECGRGRTAP